VDAAATLRSDITVLLPVRRWGDGTDDAVRSVLDQHGVEPRVLLITNGPDAETHTRAKAWADRDPRVRTLHCDAESLPTALNAGVAAAETPLLARMDADDLSHPDRFDRQARFLDQYEILAGCGCTGVFLDAEGDTVHVVTPPATAAEARWRLLINNVFVHGSMMLRKDAVLAVGGYDESLPRGQDYDLWLRLAGRGLAGIPDVLYTYRMPTPDPANGPLCEVDARQADVTASRLLAAWRSLPPGEDAEVRPVIVKLLRGQAGARAELEALMETAGPTRAALTAWLWSCRLFPVARTDNASRARRVADAAGLPELQAGELWLWGAGDLGRYVLASSELGPRVRGLIDDHRAGTELRGRPIVQPSEVPEDATVLITSELYEQAIWAQSAPLRDRGVRIIRMPNP
jgi:hypothetical protein